MQFFYRNVHENHWRFHLHIQRSVGAIALGLLLFRACLFSQLLVAPKIVEATTSYATSNAARTNAVAGIPTYTNAQKLSLPANTAVGTRVKVSDGFVVSGTGVPELDGFWSIAGTNNGKPWYQKPGRDFGTPNTGINWQVSGGGHWTIDQSSTHIDSDSDSSSFPWETTWVGSGLPITLTHPAVQQLAAPSSALTAVFISGAGTAEADGIYTFRPNAIGSGFINGRKKFVLLGQPDDPSDDGYTVYWSGSQWSIYGTEGGGDPFYASDDDVQFPWLVATWVAIAGSNPVPAAASITQGELVAGIKFGSNYYAVTTPVNGRNAYHDVLGVAPDFTFNGTIWTDGIHNGVGTPAFPWSVTGITITQDDVCAEENWDNVP